MKKKVTKIKKTKVTLESLNDNLEKFQLLVVQQFERSWLEFSNIKTEIIDIKKQVELVHSEEIDDLRAQLNSIYKILEVNNLIKK